MRRFGETPPTWTNEFLEYPIVFLIPNLIFIEVMSIDQIAAGGVVGAGGAGFPTHVKLSSRGDVVVVNAAECEPLLHKDKELIRNYADRLIFGLSVSMGLIGASRGIFGVKGKYVDVIAGLRSGLLSGMEVIPLDDIYPAGDELVLIYETVGRVVAPGGIPLSVGVVVLNVETVFNIAAAVGGEPVTDKFISVSGAVNSPCTVRAPVGAALSVVISAAGGVNISDPAFVVGGAMMGYIESDLSKPVIKTTGGVIVLPKDHFVVQRKLWDWSQVKRIGRAACDQCCFCTELCPRNLLGHPIEPHRAMRSLGFSADAKADVKGTQFCSECNLCSYCSCPEGLDPRNVCAENKRRILNEIRNGAERWTNPPFRKERPMQHFKNRRMPTERLIKKIGLASYVNKAPLKSEVIEVDRVIIPLRQHIGAPSTPVIKLGEQVKKGDLIAQKSNTAIGANIHASISGKITNISNDMIEIRNS
ncbi:MAG: SLBB domain-containing protein [Planctomycetaceae bacterium]|jgi:Na+-translocating ferredoxin:NAD+ oxidoreductase RnfC subunit|nr:SLBB domain-containing protein [Planctomycetaceae bacterium]